MARKVNITTVFVGITISFVIFLAGIGEANSFPFRSVHPGDSLPSVTIKNLKDQQNVALDSFQGKPLIAVFFGADIATKKERSIETLKVIHELEEHLAEKGVTTLVVDVQEEDTPDIINDVISQSGLGLPVYSDVDRQAYGGLGIFVMPSILLVGADGKITSGMGYSSDLHKRLKGEIEILLGEKTQAQVEEELRPQMVEKSKEEKGANRHFHLGKTMLERGQPESAIREFVKALEYEPEMGPAHVYLGCLLLDAGKLDEAKAELEKGMDLEPDMPAGLMCQARLKAAQGNLDEAIDDLNFMMLRNSRHSELHYYLGVMLEEKNDITGAAKEYRKAYELLEKKEHTN
ncbi:MAG: tetratricopeptide repeat protein [Proteobacteria bacterium]|nr:tetratricopeptide repeat protein [Pseudomonadota bacterium]MBU1688476.1 tetratricopeptide repeat protein [Pseudomonadota bacterium]